MCNSPKPSGPPTGTGVSPTRSPRSGMPTGQRPSAPVHPFVAKGVIGRWASFDARLAIASTSVIRPLAVLVLRSAT